MNSLLVQIITEAANLPASATKDKLLKLAAAGLSGTAEQPEAPRKASKKPAKRARKAKTDGADGTQREVAPERLKKVLDVLARLSKNEPVGNGSIAITAKLTKEQTRPALEALHASGKAFYEGERGQRVWSATPIQK